MTQKPSDRLKTARQDAGFQYAKDAIDAFGWRQGTYYGHENGTRQFDMQDAERYARAFKVDPFWLLYGIGPGRDPELRAIWNDLQILPPDDLSIVAQMVQRLRNAREREHE